VTRDRKGERRKEKGERRREKRGGWTAEIATGRLVNFNVPLLKQGTHRKYAPTS
jgi:hypothetical protein